MNTEEMLNWFEKNYEHFSGDPLVISARQAGLRKVCHNLLICTAIMLIFTVATLFIKFIWLTMLSGLGFLVSVDQTVMCYLQAKRTTFSDTKGIRCIPEHFLKLIYEKYNGEKA